MILPNILKKLRKEAGLTQTNIAQKLGITQNSYSRYESGKRKIETNLLLKIAKLHNVSVSYLLGESDNKKTTEIVETIQQLHEYKVLNQALATGTGFHDTDEIEYDIVYWKNDINYDQAVWIKGDSMEPTYPNWDVALIIEQSCFDYEGQVCAVDDVKNGKSYIKCVYTGENGLILKSINTSLNVQGKLKYPDIFLPFDSAPRVIGKVIGHFTPEQV